jgi:branched-chain amino acid transport system permease protein
MSSSGKERVEQVLRTIWTPLLLSALMVAIWLVITYVVGDVFYHDEAEKFFLRLLIVLALQMFSGNSGILSFGQVAFMAVGAYTSALLTIPTAIKQFTFLSMPHLLKQWVFPAQFSPLEGTIAGGVAALIVAMVFGVPIVRLVGVAAGIATLAILVAMSVFIQQTSSITRGTSTQIGVPQTTTLRATLIWVILAIILAFAFKQSRIGLRLRASRENDRAARSVGVHVARERYIAFALSGFVCGLVGAIYAHYFITFSYLDFYFDLTFLTIAMLVVGGMGSVSGAVVGTCFLTVIYVFFQRFEVNGIAGATVPSGTADVVMALALLVALILRPKGLTAGREIPWPGDSRWLQRMRQPQAPPAAQAPSAE